MSLPPRSPELNGQENVSSSSCSRTDSRTESSNPSTVSSITAATPGTHCARNVPPRKAGLPQHPASVQRLLYRSTNHLAEMVSYPRLCANNSGHYRLRRWLSRQVGIHNCPNQDVHRQSHAQKMPALQDAFQAILKELGKDVQIRVA
jgi:hypothetical protein